MSRRKDSELPEHGAERRSLPTARGTLLRRLRGFFARPLAIKREGLSFHLVVGDRRAVGRGQAVSLHDLRSELGTRLLSHAQEWSPQLMRHLTAVHDVLGRKGWKGVQAMPAGLLAKALVQAEMLQADDATAAMTALVGRLSAMKTAAELHDSRQLVRTKNAEEDAGRVQVSEATHEEFQALERSWTGSVPLNGIAGR